MTIKVERMQPEGMNIRMSAGQPSYSHVVTVNGTGKIVFIAGQLARDMDGNCVGKGDMRAQMEQTFQNLDRCLRASSQLRGVRGQLRRDDVGLLGTPEQVRQRSQEARRIAERQVALEPQLEHVLSQQDDLLRAADDTRGVRQSDLVPELAQQSVAECMEGEDR